MKILTFDIEDWFHILDNPSTSDISDWKKYESRLNIGLERILQLLNENNVKATFFILGWVAEKHPHLIKKISELGYSIGSHSYRHQLVYNQSRKEFCKDLDKSIFILEDITGQKVKSYRAPGFSIKQDTIWFFEELMERGIEIDCSIFPAKRGHGGLPGFPSSKPTLIKFNEYEIFEFPINFKNSVLGKFIFSGGGYFRVMPKAILKVLFNNSDYVMTYFHPRDFDPDQPMIEDLSFFRKFKSYYGLHSTFEKLNFVIKNNQFIDLEKATQIMKNKSNLLEINYQDLLKT